MEGTDANTLEPANGPRVPLQVVDSPQKQECDSPATPTLSHVRRTHHAPLRRNMVEPFLEYHVRRTHHVLRQMNPVEPFPELENLRVGAGFGAAVEEESNG